MAKQALGKGLGALISRQKEEVEASKEAAAALSSGDPASGETIRAVELSRIVASPFQPRQHFREEQLNELVESIREHGVIQPLIVREVDGKLELIAGERRWRAATLLELTEVPVIVRDASDRDVLELSLIENLQREDLDPIEEALAYVRLAREFDLRQEDIAKRVGKNRATVANSMRLLDLAKPVQDLLAHGQISTGHAKAILGLKSKEEQKLVAEMVVKKVLTVRQTERLVSEKLAPSGDKVARKRMVSGVDQAVQALEGRLQKHLATKVRLHHGAKKGKIEIEYYGDEDLERICSILRLK
ncbi:MAG: ParB/RepB/Spo0J family partition protein [Verrucomicrobiota bacterium]